MSIELTARPYGEDSSPEEIQAMRDRIYLYRGDVVMYKEVPVQSIFQLGIFEERIKEVTAALDSFALLIDITNADRPGAAIRARLMTLFNSFPKMRAVAAFSGKNFVLNVAAKFVLSSLTQTPFSVHKTLDQALEALNHVAN